MMSKRRKLSVMGDKICSDLCDAIEDGRMNRVDHAPEMRADVNQRCDFRETQLMQACASGNKDLVEELLQKGACVNGSVQSKCTPLMAAVQGKHIDIVQCLLENSADPNVQNLNGETALHKAIYCERKIGKTLLQLLLERPVKLLSDEYGNTPLSLAVLRGRVDILDLLLGVQPMTREARINALELCATFRAPHDMDTVFEVLQRAMEERYSDSFDILHKPDQVPDPDLGYVLESRSPQELSERRNNSAALMIECLAIRKRNAYFGGRTQDCFRDCGIHNRLLIEGHQKEMCFILGHNCDDFHYALCSVVNFFDWSLLTDEIPLFSDVTVYLNACRKHLKNYANHSWDPGNMYLNVNEVVRYLLICICLVDVGNKEHVQFLKETTKDISDCLQHDYQPTNTYSLLTAAVSYWENCRDDLGETLLEDLIVFLIECGASIDCRDRYGDTPLHILAKSKNTVASSMARLLLENGAHLDFLDARRQTPAQCARTEKMKALLESNPRSLQCLAAHVILEHNLSLNDLPNPLKRFVAEHGGSHV